MMVKKLGGCRSPTRSLSLDPDQRLVSTCCQQKRKKKVTYLAHLFTAQAADITVSLHRRLKTQTRNTSMHSYFSHATHLAHHCKLRPRTIYHTSHKYLSPIHRSHYHPHQSICNPRMGLQNRCVPSYRRKISSQAPLISFAILKTSVPGLLYIKLFANIRFNALCNCFAVPILPSFIFALIVLISRGCRMSV